MVFSLAKSPALFSAVLSSIALVILSPGWPLLAAAGDAPRPEAGKFMLDRLEASVNAAPILSSDVRQFRKSLGLRAQLDPLFAGTVIAEAGPKASGQQIVEFLIDEKIILSQFPVSDAEVEQEVNSIQTNNRLDRARLKEALREQGFSFNDYFELIRTSIAKRNLLDRDIRTKVAISDDDVKNYFFNQAAKSGKGSLNYHVRLLTVTASNFKTPAAAREVAERALRAIKGGESFEEVARRTSDDASAAAGGDLGTLPADQLSEAIRTQLKKMKIGEVSDLQGDPKSRFFILQLVDVTSGDSSALEKAKEEIRAQLSLVEFKHQVALWLERQRQVAFIRRATNGNAPNTAP